MKISNKHHDLKQTNSYFTAKGTLSGTSKDNFGGVSKTKTGKDMARVRFDIKTENDNTIYGIELMGFPRENVTYTSRVGEESFNYSIPWDDRYNKKVIENTTNGAEVSLAFGKKIALERVSYKDKDGSEKTKNDVKELTDFDCAKFFAEKKENGVITDGTPLYVNGRFVPNVWKDDKGNVNKSIKLTPDKIYLSSEVNFDELSEEDKVNNARFITDVVVKEYNDVNGDTYLTGILVGYDYIEEMEFKLSPQIAMAMKSRVKPYTSMKLLGKIQQEKQEEVVEVKQQDTCWGDFDKFAKSRNGRTKTVWYVIAGDPNTIDSDSYSEFKIEQAKQALKAWRDDYKAGKSKEEIASAKKSATSDFGDFGSMSGFDFD